LRRISEASAHVSLKRSYQTICESANEGYKQYLNSPDVAIHAPRTMATNINDHIWAQLVNRLDGVAEPIFDRRRSLRFLKFGRRRPILLWVKKLNPARQYSKVQTANEHKTSHASMLDEGQTELLPSAQILTVGYLLSHDRRSISRVSITPPSKRGRYPDWWIDLAMLSVVGKLEEINSSANFRIEIRRSSHQRKLAS
jgi:hypothetical protein